MKRYLVCMFALFLVVTAGAVFGALTNPGFENGLTGWSGDVRAARMSLGTDGGHTGSNYCISTGVGDWASVAQGIDNSADFDSGVSNLVDPNKYYRLSAWVRVAETTDVCLRYRWFPSADRNDIGQQTVTAGTWVQLVSDWMRPNAGDTALGYFEVHSVNNDVTINVDDCMLEEDVVAVTGYAKTSDGAGIQGVAVEASDGDSLYKATTAADGSYTFYLPPTAAGKSVYMTGTKTFYLAGEVSIAALAGGTNTAPDMIMDSAATNHITGKVVDQATGLGVAGVTVGINWGASSVGFTADTITQRTASDGSFDFLTVPDIFYVVVAPSLGYKLASVPSSGDWEVDASVGDVRLADIQLIANSPLVDISTAGLTPGSTVAEWNNAGSLGGKLAVQWGGQQPLATVVGGKQAVLMWGANPMALVSTDGSAAINAPVAIVGTRDENRNPLTNPVFTLVAWLYRTELGNGWVDGGFCSWSPWVYAANFQYGGGDSWAADHWVAGNLGWGTLPAAGAWHQIIYTSNGNTETLYVDGAQNSTAGAPTAFNNISDQTGVAETGFLGAQNPFVFGAIAANDESNFWPERSFRGAIGALRIYDTAVNAADAATLYSTFTLSNGASYNITGHVYAPDGVTGIDGATVQYSLGGVVLGSVTTSGGGAYTTALGPGTYDVGVTASGYLSAKKTGVVVSTSDLHGQDITLAPIPSDRMAISIDAVEATSAGVVNHGYYAGNFVPAEGNPTVGNAGPASDLLPAINFAGNRWQLRDSSNKDILTCSELAGNQPFTVAAWVYQDLAVVNGDTGHRDMYFTWAPLGQAGAAGCGLGWELWGGAFPGFDSGNTPVVNWEGCSTDWSFTSVDTSKMPWGSWVHIVTLYDGTALHFYKNGTEVTSTTMPKTYNLQTAVGQPFSLGGFSNGWGDGQFWGSISRLKMWSRGLTQDEISADFNDRPTIPVVTYGQVVGANNKAVKTDAKLQGLDKDGKQIVVKVWGKLVSTVSDGYYISDGYDATGVKIKTSSAPSSDPIIVVKGVVKVEGGEVVVEPVP